MKIDSAVQTRCIESKETRQGKKIRLGQHAIPDEALDWVPRAKDEAGR